MGLAISSHQPQSMMWQSEDTNEMILRFGCPRPSALLIHTHALFTLGASGCHLGHNSHLFHLTASLCHTIMHMDTHLDAKAWRERSHLDRGLLFWGVRTWTRKERSCEKRKKRKKRSYMAVGETLSDKNESVWFRSQLGFVVIVEQDGWNR